MKMYNKQNYLQKTKDKPFLVLETFANTGKIF